MSEKHRIARTNLVCWIVTILLISACFMVFFTYQKFQDFKQTGQLLRRQQERMTADFLAIEAGTSARNLTALRSTFPEPDPAKAAALLAVKLKDFNLGAEGLLVIAADGTVLLAPTQGPLHTYLQGFTDKIRPALAKGTASGQIRMTELGIANPGRWRWHASPMPELGWQVIALCDMQRQELVLSANLNQLRIDILLEAALLLLVSAAVVLVAVRLAYAFARRIELEVNQLTDFCHGGLAQHAALRTDFFQFQEFETIGAALAAMMRQVRDLLAELNSLAVRSTISSQSQSGTLAGVSHQILSRLNGIIGTAQLLQVRSKSEAERRHDLETIISSGQAIATLIEDVDYTCVLDTDNFRPTVAPCHLQQVREQVMRALQRPAAARQHALAWEVGPGLPEWALCDGHLLRHLLINLAEIGIYGQSGGEVRIAMQPAPTQTGKAGLRCAVTLCGLGLTQSELDEIANFPHISRRLAPVGLRVAICRRLAEIMPGRLTLRLDEQRTLHCEIDFEAAPVAQAAAATAPGPAPVAQSVAAAGRVAGLQVLLVEDDSVNMDVAVEMLRHLGANVDTASDGAAAVAKVIPRGHYDLVLMDCEMPVMDGYAASREIRRLEAGQRRTPIIALSGYAMPEDEARCRDAGMDGLVAKPVSLEDLQGLLAKYASGR